MLTLVVPRLGRWSASYGQWLTFKRMYWAGRWTPLCRVRRRYS
jgi:hypothetical protein